MTAAQQKSLQQLERVDGAARLVCARRASGTGIADLYQRAPCRLLFPEADAGDPFTAALLTTSGGLTGGDRISIAARIEDGAVATVTTQAAEKIYRSSEGCCTIGVELDVGANAWAEWLMQETILFDGASLARQIDVNVAATGRLLAVESLVFGRRAMGEVFQRGYVRDRWRVRLDGRLAWADALKLEGDIAGETAKPFGLGRAAGCATLVYVGPDAAQWLDTMRGAVERSGAPGGATNLGGLLVARLWAEDASILRLAVAHCITRMRHAVAGLPQRMPRLWSI